MSEDFVKRNLDKAKKNIKEHVDIIRVAGDYLELIHDGNPANNVVHVKKGTPYDSMVFYRDTSSYLRWSRAKGGDVIDFVQEIGDLTGVKSYTEALKLLKDYVDPEF